MLAGRAIKNTILIHLYISRSFYFKHGECHEIQRADHDPASHKDQTADIQIRTQHQEIPADSDLPQARRGRGWRGPVVTSVDLGL